MRRVAVTGIGVIAPGGSGSEAFWTAITSGASAVRHITFFDTSGFRSRIAAEIDFDPHAAGLNDQDICRMDRHIQFGVAAAIEAVHDSALTPEHLGTERAAVTMGSALGAVMTLEEAYVVLSNRGRHWEVDPAYTPPFLDRALTSGTLSQEVALRLGTHGPATTVSTGSIAGIDAVAHGSRLIRDGEADVVLVGGAEAPISPVVLASLDAIKATSAHNDDPEHASRPFDADRDGFVLGEGSAVLVLEDAEHARTRGAHIYCCVEGSAGRASAYHMTGLKTDGADLTQAIADALQRAHLGAADVDYVSAAGSGGKQSDRYECAGLNGALGTAAGHVPVSSIKGAIGHALGAAGALQVAAAALAIEHRAIPPMVNYGHPDPECALAYARGAAKGARIETALVTAGSFGGFHAAMLVTRHGEAQEPES